MIVAAQTPGPRMKLLPRRGDPGSSIRGQACSSPIADAIPAASISWRNSGWEIGDELGSEPLALRIVIGGE